MPGANQSGRYRDRKGTTSDLIENGSQASIAIVDTWITMNVPASRPAKRWTSSTTKRGQRRNVFLPAIVKPRPTPIVTTTYAANPAARATYQSSGLDVRCI